MQILGSLGREGTSALIAQKQTLSALIPQILAIAEKCGKAK